MSNKHESMDGNVSLSLHHRSELCFEDRVFCFQSSVEDDVLNGYFLLFCRKYRFVWKALCFKGCISLRTLSIVPTLFTYERYVLFTSVHCTCDDCLKSDLLSMLSCVLLEVWFCSEAVVFLNIHHVQ